MTDTAPPSQPAPLVKHHSERSHSRSNSTSQQQAAPVSGGVPASSPSPPPTAHCPHVSSLLNLNLIRQRFRSRTFQKAFVADQLECCDCNVHFPKDHLWACLQCTNVDCARCGRHDQHHASKHYKAEKHALAIHLHTRVIWCYVCDAEVPDEFDTKQLQGDAIPPQLVRSALDKEDAAAEVEEAGDNAGSMDADDDAEEPEEITWRTYLNNPNGGITGLSNLGNTCFFNAGTQALLHCPPLVAFFSELSGTSDERTVAAMADAHTPVQRANQEMRLKLTEDFSTLLRKTWGGRYHLCVPTDLLRDILLLNPFFRGYGQHDSQEYIRCILDNLHEAVKLKVFYEYDLKKQLAQSKEAAAEKEKLEAKREREEEMKEKDDAAAASSNGGGSSSNNSTPKAAAPIVKRYPESSIIASLFQGTLESRVECSNCHHVSTTRDPFYDLSLEIPRENQLKKIGAERGTDALTPQAKGGFFSGLGNFLGLSTPTLSLETCLHSFCTSDSLLQKDQYKCDQCKLKVNATKILSLGSESTLPEVLSIHIKRFSHNSYFGSKIGRHVTFPLENLDMAPFLTQQRTPSEIASAAAAAAAAPAASKDKKKELKSSSSSASASASSSSPALYDLFAIVRHLGSVSGGHYIAYCRSHTTGKWFEFDDKHVTEISEEKVAKIEAYVLFYRRKHKAAPLARIMKQIEAVTVHHPMATVAAAASSASASPSPSAASRPYRYVSRYWLKKMEVLGRPEPIDNRDLCCPHGIPKPLPLDGGDRALVITPAGWESLFAEYGGGPIVDSCEGSTLCEPCQLPLIRKAERARIAAIDTQANRQAADDPFFLIHSPWLQQWRAFVSAGGPRPGPITNHLLFEPDGRTLLPNLARLDHYRALHGLVWNELQAIYGGGPIIKRPTVDIYAAAQPTMVDDDDDTEEQEEDEDAESSADEEVDIPAAQAPSASEPAAAATRTTRSNSGSSGTNAAASAQPQSYAYVNQTRQ